MSAHIILGIGSGRCGTRSLAEVLNRQPDCRVTHEERPVLAWDADQKGERILARFARWRRQRNQHLVGDVASFYLPYLDEALSAEPDLRVICLQRPREEVIHSFGRWLDRVHPLPTDHWTAQPQSSRHHHPVWSTIFPKYEEPTRAAGIGRYPVLRRIGNDAKPLRRGSISSQTLTQRQSRFPRGRREASVRRSPAHF